MSEISDMEQWKWVPYRTLEKQSDPPQARNWAGQVEFLRNLQAIQDSDARTKFSPADRVEPIAFDRQRSISIDLYTNPRVGQWRKDYGNVLVNEYHVKPPQWFINRVNAVGGELSGGTKAARASGRKPKTEGKQAPRKIKSKEEEESQTSESEEDELLQSMQSLRVTPPEATTTPARRKRPQSPKRSPRVSSDTVVMVRLLAINVQGQVLACDPDDEVVIDLTEESEAQLLTKFNIHFDETQMIKFGWFEADGTYSHKELLPGVHAASLNYAASKGRFGHHLWIQWDR